jgi:hypothetical protein
LEAIAAANHTCAKITGHAFDANPQIVPSVIFTERNSDLSVSVVEPSDTQSNDATRSAAARVVNVHRDQARRFAVQEFETDEQFYGDTESIAFPKLDDRQLAMPKPLGSRHFQDRSDR